MASSAVPGAAACASCAHPRWSPACRPGQRDLRLLGRAALTQQMRAET